MTPELLLWLPLAFPALAGALAAAASSPRRILVLMCGGVLLSGAVGVAVAAVVLIGGPVTAVHGWLRLDALSAYHLAVMHLIYSLSSLYALAYFRAETGAHRLTVRQTRFFAGLWCGSLSAMTLVLVSNNLGMMWVGIEATTLLTAFLICLPESRESLEAMWKYLMICSIGVAFAFMGTLLAAAATRELQLMPADALLWTALRDQATRLHPALMRAAFIFLLVGYGTKAGLAPMHSWLPDAHSQAPAPVSALFSGFMLNASLYCLMRYMPLVDAAPGNAGWSRGLLTGFGGLSIVIAAAFILVQHDLKRLLAYHSVEHLGIITLGLGFGGLGVFGALFHTLNHSLCKTLAFFAAGRLGQKLGTHDLRRMVGAWRVSRVWSLAIFGSVLALIGMAPFSLFMSEFQILGAGMASGAYFPIAIFLVGAGVVFAGALGHAIPLFWGERAAVPEAAADSRLDWTLACLPLAVLLLLGLWMPAPLVAVLQAAAAIINSTGGGQ